MSKEYRNNHLRGVWSYVRNSVNELTGCIPMVCAMDAVQSADNKSFTISVGIRYDDKYYLAYGTSASSLLEDIMTKINGGLDVPHSHIKHVFYAHPWVDEVGSPIYRPIDR